VQSKGARKEFHQGFGDGCAGALADSAGAADSPPTQVLAFAVQLGQSIVAKAACVSQRPNGRLACGRLCGGYSLPSSNTASCVTCKRPGIVLESLQQFDREIENIARFRFAYWMVVYSIVGVSRMQSANCSISFGRKLFAKSHSSRGFKLNRVRLSVGPFSLGNFSFEI